VSRALPETWQNFLEWPREQLRSDLLGVLNYEAENPEPVEVGTE
jgi:hypothetical protein